MDQYIEFASRHWELMTAFVIILILVIANEMRERILGIPKIAPYKVTDLINHQSAQVIDIRETNAFLEGHIIGAKNIPHKIVAESLNKLDTDKAKPIILIDAVGQQSNAVGKLLQKAGYQNIMILAGGISAWRNENLPVVKK